MPMYQARLQADIDRIRQKLMVLGRGVLVALENATRSALTRDIDLATETILGDMPINRRYRELDHLCHLFVARHFPSAGHLRLVSAVMRLSKTLERIGDYAETISRSALQLEDHPPEKITEDIRTMSQHAVHTLEQSLEAFREESAELARGTLNTAREYTSTYDRMFADLITEGEKGSRPIAELFSLLAILNRLERVIHQAKNICEQTIFVATGETKVGKTFDILLVDDTNTGASLLAEAHCRKAYPNAGRYQSAGWTPGERVDPKFVGYAESKGLSLSAAVPRDFHSVAHLIPNLDIIIDLSGSARENIQKIPYHTMLLSWPLEYRDDPEVVCRQLLPRFNDLMRRIRGDEEECG